ncbi:MULTISPECIES: hypothetical protein [unclassified Bradyrhizobium]
MRYSPDVCLSPDGGGIADIQQPLLGAEPDLTGTMLLRIGCRACSTTREYVCGMPYLYDRSLVVWSFPFLIFLSGCSDKLECDSIETRKAVLQMVADDHRNPLVNYAAENSTAKANLENAKPLYLLGQRIVTTSTSQDKRTLQCSGEISVSVGDRKASKEVEFTVQQSLDGKISVSVVPFQF